MSHIVLVLVGVLVLEQVTLGGPTVINPCVFAKMESIGSSKCWAEDAVSRTRTTTRTRATKTLSLNAHSPPTGLLCSKIDDVADSLTFVPGPRLTSRPSVGDNRQYAGKAARPKTALTAKAMRKSDTAYSP